MTVVPSVRSASFPWTACIAPHPAASRGPPGPCPSRAGAVLVASPVSVLSWDGPSQPGFWELPKPPLCAGEVSPAPDPYMQGGDIGWQERGRGVSPTFLSVFLRPGFTPPPCLDSPLDSPLEQVSCPGHRPIHPHISVPSSPKSNLPSPVPADGLPGTHRSMPPVLVHTSHTEALLSRPSWAPAPPCLPLGPFSLPSLEQAPFALEGPPQEASPLPPGRVSSCPQGLHMALPSSIHLSAPVGQRPAGCLCLPQGHTGGRWALPMGERVVGGQDEHRSHCSFFTAHGSEHSTLWASGSSSALESSIVPSSLPFPGLPHPPVCV